MSTNKPNPTVAVLMATYNGERYVAEQIQSILRQTYPAWTLFVRDDGSQDGTAGIVEQFALQHSTRIRVVPNQEGRLGVDKNFSTLLGAAEAEYYMFCDQDDVWLPNKIENTLACMQSLEKDEGDRTPLLVYTDLRPVDEHLREIDASIWHYGRHNPDCGEISRVLRVFVIPE